MRVISGIFGGRRLKSPKGGLTRPTSERVREAVFSILSGRPGPCDVLDLFCGSGLLGIEALSRGAQRVVFVDAASPAIRCVRENIAVLGVEKQTAVHRSDVITWLDRVGASQRFDWVFVDPPYDSDLADRTLARLANTTLLAPSGVVVVEHDRRNPPQVAHNNLVREEYRQYGDTVVSFYSEASQMKSGDAIPMTE